ncbi:hypothetical protein [Yoonia sp. SDW83-1]|uniref:hypothetical protein n=1 Tax=Yoonia sp. SDW83-1 TaxID=3366945 RepID=UPI00398C726B
MAKMDKGLIGSAVANASRRTTVWYFVLAPVVLAYLGAAFYLVADTRPLSRLFQLSPTHAEAWLVDLILVALPLLGAIAAYIYRKNASDMQRRHNFLAAFAGRELVQARHNPNLIYAVLDTATGPDKITIQLVWTPDGPHRGKDIYADMNREQVAPLDQQHFLGQ